MKEADEPEDVEFQEEEEEEEMVEEEGSDAEDDEDDAKLAELEAEAAQADATLQENPYLYDTHVRRIQLRSRLGDLDELRAARESMRERYPLSPSIWLDWLRDERRVLEQCDSVDSVEEQRRRVLSLFRSALEDYASVDVAAEFCLFATGQLEAMGADAVRAVFDECLAVVGRFAGLHDQRVWESYQDFEQWLLASVDAEKEPEAAERQRRRVSEIFKRRLSVPHVSLERTWRECLDWLGVADESSAEQSAPEHLAAVQRSRSELAQIEPFETLLIDEPENSAVHFKRYISAACCGTAQQLAVYERAVTNNCLDAELWDNFVQFVWDQFEPGPKVLKVCERAVRNCPWYASLWCRQALCSECMGNDYRQRVQPVYTAALSAGIEDSGSVLSLWLAYLDSARRQLVAKGDQSGLAEWRRLCQSGVDSVHEQFGYAGDAEASLTRYLALQLALAGEMPDARQAWDSVMKRPGLAKRADVWLSLFDFERRFGDRKHARRCLARAVNSVDDVEGSERLFARIVDYEREEGDLTGYIEAVRRVRKQRSLLAQRATVKEAASAKSNKRQAAGDGEAPARSKKARKATTAESEAKRPAKPEADESTFKKPLPPSTSTKKKPAAVEPEAEKDSAEHGQTVPHDPSKEHRTVFVSNLDFKLTDSDLRQLMSEAGEVTCLRLVRDYKGRSKGYAYVEFNSSAEADKALSMDRRPVNGRPMFVSECKQDRGGKGEFKFSKGLERNKLFVRNLPKTMDQTAFAAMLNAQPNCRAVRLATFRNGVSKGHGYAEFSNEEAAGAALKALNGATVGDNQIEVAISNPPMKHQQHQHQHQQQQRLGGGSAGAKAADRQRERISLLPRQLAAQQQKSTGDGGGDKSGGGGGGMSNADFRNLLLGTKNQ